jgi:predicted enzyme related to lactoylglutathione lyase
MAKVVGLGGVFVKAKDKEALARWYQEALGVGGQWGAMFKHAPGPDGEPGVSLFTLFKDGSDYFAPSSRPFMVNFVVDDLDALLQHLKQRGDQVLDRGTADENGKFGYVVDPEGTLLELWQPAG